MRLINAVFGNGDAVICRSTFISPNTVPALVFRRSANLSATLSAPRHYGRAFCNRLTKYFERSCAEVEMRCLKFFGEAIAARDPNRRIPHPRQVNM